MKKQNPHQTANPPDPLKVRSTTARVIQNLRFVKIQHSEIKKAAATIRRRVRSEKLLTQNQFGATQITPQRVFIQDAVNFCFWSKKGEPKWKVEFPKGEVHNGWDALTACFERAVKENIPILEAKYLENITHDKVQGIFRGMDGTKIPLVSKRHKIFQETGSILNTSFSGNIESMLKAASYSAPTIAKGVVENFPSFNDATLIDGKKVNFFKRAQIFAYDLSLLKSFKLTGINSLTAFADYKLPQIMRSFGLLKYEKSLAKKVDSMELIPKHSREEIEIRAATIQACEKIANRLKLSPATVDNALWLLSQKTKRKMKPYHRTLTTFY